MFCQQGFQHPTVERLGKSASDPSFVLAHDVCPHRVQVGQFDVEGNFHPAASKPVDHVCIRRDVPDLDIGPPRISMVRIAGPIHHDPVPPIVALLLDGRRDTIRPGLQRNFI
jgi:hypothetical protein